MESHPQNPEFRKNPENFRPCVYKPSNPCVFQPVQSRFYLFLRNHRLHGEQCVSRWFLKESAIMNQHCFLRVGLPGFSKTGTVKPVKNGHSQKTENWFSK